MIKWQKYIDKTKDTPPRPWLVKSIPYLSAKDNALDMGAGSLNDTKFLIENGFGKVDVLDLNDLPESFKKEIPPDKVNFIISSFEDYNFPVSHYDLVNAQFSLPFTDPKSFNRVFSSMKKSLKKGGIFVGQFFGTKDEWNDGTRNITFHTKDQVQNLMTGFKWIEFLEEEKDAKPVIGEIKHWHIFHVIGIKEVEIE